MQSLKLVFGLAAAFGVATGCAEDTAQQESSEAGAGGSARTEDGGEHVLPDAGSGAGGSSTGSAPTGSGGAAPETDAGSSGASTGSGGSAQGSGGAAASSGGSKASGGAHNGSGGSHDSGGSHNGSGGTSNSSGGAAPATGGAPAASGGAAGAGGTEGTRPGLSDGCLSCAMAECGAVAKQCKDDVICSGCIAGKGKGGDCAPFDSVFGGLLMCVCSVPACVESCGPSCPRR